MAFWGLKSKKKAGLGKEAAADMMEVPPNSEMGDFGLPCFKIAKTMRKVQPVIATGETSGELVVKLGRAASPTVTTVHVAKQQSIDELFAINSGMWVCRKCETLNEQNTDRCAVCGYRK